jgi:Fe-S-cluster-containing hydrogenase component 2/CRP-like cAMP-binding protein/thioredoxin reductase
VVSAAPAASDGTAPGAREHFRIAIIGSGPGGLSAAVTAARYGVNHILLERADHLSDTIYKYQKGKKVMAHPMRLPLLGDLPFALGCREDILANWQRVATAAGVNLRPHSELRKISGQRNGFLIALADGSELTADEIVLAIGLQGNLRQLTVPGADAGLVRYQLDDPDEYRGKRITVIGAGDAGLENALALCGHNEVTIVNRQPDLSRAKPGNISDTERAIRAGRIRVYHKAEPSRIDPDGLLIDTPNGAVQVAAEIIIARLGAIPPRKLLQECGIRFPNEDPAAIPELSDSYESNVPGLYIIGALAGYTLIKQAINQGHELIRRLAGDPTEPADEKLLRDCFAAAFPLQSVAEVLEYVRARVPILAGLSTLQLRETMLDCTIRRFAAGEIVFRRGEYSNSLWNIAEGGASVALDEARPDEGVRIGAGEFFGELGLLSGRRRSATVAASEPSVMLEIPLRAMRRLQTSVDAVQRELDRVAIRRLVHTTLGAGRPAAELEEIVAAAQLQRYKAGECIVREGGVIDALYILRSGSAIVSDMQNGRVNVLNFVNAGSLLGERGFLDEAARRSATISAAIASEVVRIDADSVRAALGRMPHLRTVFNKAVQFQLEQGLRATVAQVGRREATTRATAIADFLVSKGVGEATNVFIIDETICTRCGNCEAACAATHGGISRVSRELGSSAEAILLPLACRHCETPHCMSHCPVDAISRAPTGEVIIDQETCIGCEKCAEDCPYDVISMVSAGAGANPKANWLTWLLQGVGLAGRNGRAGDAGDKSEKKAVKCDLCRNTGGTPACVTACPTGAAARVEPEAYMTWLREGRAPL